MDKRLELRLPEELKVEVERRARRGGLTVSEYIRDLLGESISSSFPAQRRVSKNKKEVEEQVSGLRSFRPVPKPKDVKRGKS